MTDRFHILSNSCLLKMPTIATSLKFCRAIVNTFIISHIQTIATKMLQLSHIQIIEIHNFIITLKLYHLLLYNPGQLITRSVVIPPRTNMIEQMSHIHVMPVELLEFLSVLLVHQTYQLEQEKGHHLKIKNKSEVGFLQLLTLSQTSPGFYVSAVQVFSKHCEKRRNCS